MPESKNENNVQPEEQQTGAFGKDKQFGNRLDQVVALHEPFLLLGGYIQEETQETKFGNAEVARVLIQKLDPHSGAPIGSPIRANTVASAVVEKVKALTPAEVAEGPVCQLQIVDSKRQGGKAMVMSWIRNLNDADDFSEFGLDTADASRLVDQARPKGERIPL